MNLDKLKTNFRTPLALVGFIIVLTYIGYRKIALFLDPDFGWHMRNGQYILEHGIPRLDPFSYTMSSFHVIVHEWLSEVFLVLLYPRIGYGGTALILVIVTKA